VKVLLRGYDLYLTYLLEASLAMQQMVSA